MENPNSGLKKLNLKSCFIETASLAQLNEIAQRRGIELTSKAPKNIDHALSLFSDFRANQEQAEQAINLAPTLLNDFIENPRQDKVAQVKTAFDDALSLFSAFRENPLQDDKSIDDVLNIHLQTARQESSDEQESLESEKSGSEKSPSPTPERFAVGNHVSRRNNDENESSAAKRLNQGPNDKRRDGGAAL